MTFRVVDTNVAIVANEKSPQASPECVLACVNELREIIDNGGIVLDDRIFIIDEYKNKLSPSGQPGVGDAFLKWVITYQYNELYCMVVHITEDESRGFLEFPEDESVQSFHRSDRKFVAVARASSFKPEILNAVDKHWWEHRHALKSCGVRVRFLCPNQFPERK